MIFQRLFGSFDRKCVMQLLRDRHAASRTRQQSVLTTARTREFSNKKIEETKDDPEMPIKYSTSNAAKWSAVQIRNSSRDRPPFEATIICGSLIAFLIYFLVLREENDIDEMLSVPLEQSLSRANEQSARK